MNRRGFLTGLPLAAGALQASRGKHGFFHIEKIGHKWVVLDPDDRPVFLRGLNHYADGTHMPLNWRERYGSRQTWRKSVRDRHREWGFNYLPPSIGPSETSAEAVDPVRTETGGRRWPTDIRRTPEWPAEHFAALDYPFTAFLEVPKQYMAGRGLPDVFSREFREMVDKRCREFVAPLNDNPNLIGYHFTHNPPWDVSNPSFRQWILDIVRDGQPAKAEWARLMHRIYGTVDRWRETYGLPIESFGDVEKLPFPLRGYTSKKTEIRDQIAFMQRIANEWYKVYTETIRTYDPNHLLLGDRNTVHLSPLPDYAIHIMAKYIDVISINAMGHAEKIFQEMEQVTLHWDGPIHLADSGAGIYNGRYAKAGFMCRNIEEFDQLYRSYMEAGLSHPQLIGFGWCGYYETPSSRSGVVDSRNDEPLDDRVTVMKKWNRWMEEHFSESVTRAGRQSPDASPP